MVACPLQQHNSDSCKYMWTTMVDLRARAGQLVAVRYNNIIRALVSKHLNGQGAICIYVVIMMT